MLIAASIALVGSGPLGVRAALAEQPAAEQLVGKTLSAVIYASESPGPVSGRSLQRIVLQAYLERGGVALFRLWDSAHAHYTAMSPGRWLLEGDRLCLDAPGRELCANVHVWGPRIAGIGIEPYAMLDGDLQLGNALGAQQRAH